VTGQPPVQPPHQPPEHPVEASPVTQPMTAAESAPAAPRPGVPKTNMWRQATSTHGGRWAIAAAAAALAVLLLLGVGVAGFVVLRYHDRVNLLGNQTGGYSRGQNGQGYGLGPGANGNQRRLPGMPGMRGGRVQVPGGLGNLLGGSALHGDVTATVNGSLQALVFQRGAVTAVSATSIALKSSDGFVGTYGRTAATISRGPAPVKGGQAFVLARVSDKVAITTVSTRANAAVPPSS
jgi:hypothetical protein